MAFLGGNAAERAARRLARKLAMAARRVVLTIRLRDGSVAARLAYEPNAPTPPAPAWPALAQAA
jgi:hypothetical protein